MTTFTTATYLVTVFVCTKCSAEMSAYEMGYSDDRCVECGCRNVERQERREERLEADDDYAEQRMAEIQAKWEPVEPADVICYSPNFLRRRQAGG